MPTLQNIHKDPKSGELLPHAFRWENKVVHFAPGEQKPDVPFDLARFVTRKYRDGYKVVGTDAPSDQPPVRFQFVAPSHSGGNSWGCRFERQLLQFVNGQVTTLPAAQFRHVRKRATMASTLQAPIALKVLELLLDKPGHRPADPDDGKRPIDRYADLVREAVDLFGLEVTTTSQKRVELQRMMVKVNEPLARTIFEQLGYEVPRVGAELNPKE